MDVHLNRQVSSEPCISPDGDPSLPDLEEKNAYSYQPSWTESIFGDSSTTITNNISKKTSLQLSEDNEPPQDTEEALIESLAFYNPNPSLDDLTHASMLSMAGRNTMFSSMRTVPLDMKIIKEDLAYYQYKLYQRFSVKLADLVRLETLGKGAFGEVTRVFNKTDRLFYALKEIKMENFKKRNYYEGAVWTEIRNLLKLNELDDPLVMKTILIDFNEDEDTCYLVMELGGGTLEEYVECMRYYGLTWKEEDLEYIMYQLVSQILKLKQVGMYHRDIKPSNVVISCKQESFKLGDFGCSCITKPGVQKLDIAGTPHYMSPELVYAILKREQIVEHDPYLSDLFSLGITMLTLIEPDLKRKDVGEFLESVVKERYPELYIILKDLLGHPSQRDEGVHKFLAKKLKVKTYPEFKAGNLGERYKLYLYLKVISKNKHIDTSLYFDMCILDDALLVIKKKIDLLTISRNPEEHNLEEVIWRIRLARCYYMQMNYESAYKELQDIMQRKELMNFEPQFALTKAKALLWMGIVKEKLGKRSSSIEDLMQCLGIRVAELDDVHEDVSEVYWYLGDMRTRQENFPGAIRAFQKCIEIGEKLEPKQRKYIAKGLLSLGLLAELRGDHEKALELFERARKIAIEAYGEHHPGVADPLLGIGYEKIILGSSDEGLDLYEEALATKIRWYGESNPEVADTYTKIAQGYDHMGEYKKALNVLGKSAVIWKKVKGEESQELADVYQLIGSVMCKKGNYLKSLEYASKVISNKEKNLGVNHPCLAGIYVWHAETCSALGLESLKQKSLESFLTIDFDRMELNRDNIKIGFRAVGLLAEDGRIDRAWEYAEKAYQMYVNLAVAKTSDTYACYCEAMGKLKLAEGKYKEALEHVKEALRIRDCLPCKDPDIETGLHNLMGDLYESMEDSRETLRWRRRSIELIERYLSKHGLLMLKALINLSRALQKVGKNGEAREKLNVAGELIEKLRVTRCHPLFNKWLDVQNSLEGRQNTIQK